MGKRSRIIRNRGARAERFGHEEGKSQLQDVPKPLKAVLAIGLALQVVWGCHTAKWCRGWCTQQSDGDEGGRGTVGSGPQLLHLRSSWTWQHAENHSSRAWGTGRTCGSSRVFRTGSEVCGGSAATDKVSLQRRTCGGRTRASMAGHFPTSEWCRGGNGRVGRRWADTAFTAAAGRRRGVGGYTGIQGALAIGGDPMSGSRTGARGQRHASWRPVADEPEGAPSSRSKNAEVEQAAAEAVGDGRAPGRGHVGQAEQGRECAREGSRGSGAGEGGASRGSDDAPPVACSRKARGRGSVASRRVPHP